MISVILTMAVLYIWTSEGGSTPPSATDIALFIEDKKEWMDALDKHWSRIGLGLQLSPKIRCASALLPDQSWMERRRKQLPER